MILSTVTLLPCVDICLCRLELRLSAVLTASPCHALSWEKQKHVGAHLTEKQSGWHTSENTLTRLLYPCLFASPPPLSDCCLTIWLRIFSNSAEQHWELSCPVWGSHAGLAVSSSSLLWWQMTCVSRSDTGSCRGGGVGFNSVKCPVIWTEFKKGSSRRQGGKKQGRMTHICEKWTFWGSMHFIHLSVQWLAITLYYNM